DEEVKKKTSLLEMMDPDEWLEKEVQVDFSVAPEIMRISMRGTETEELKVIVKAVYKAYKTEVIEQQIARRRGRQKFLAEMVSQYEDKLAKVRARQKDDEQLLASSDISARATLLAWEQHRLRTTQQDILNARSARTKAQAHLEALLANRAGRRSEPI